MADNEAYAAYEIGQWTYGKPIVEFPSSRATLKIGRFCSIADSVRILLGGEHNVHWVTTYPFNVVWPEAQSFTGHPATRGGVSIGNDVWIGRDSVIMSGCQIGNGAVIGAGSIVRQNVFPYSIVAGNPARHLRFRFSAEQIEALEQIAWWNWPIEKIIAALPLLLGPDIQQFISKYRAEPLSEKSLVDAEIDTHEC
jgi:acetyltransferase-like isoleucine patch superfamily enzyme